MPLNGQKGSKITSWTSYIQSSNPLAIIRFDAGTENRVAGSIQSPIFGGFLPLSIPVLEKVDLVAVEMSTGIYSKCGIEKDIEQFPGEISLREGVNLTVWIAQANNCPRAWLV